VELILRQFFDVASLAQNDVFPAAVSPPEMAQDDGRVKTWEMVLSEIALFVWAAQIVASRLAGLIITGCAMSLSSLEKMISMPPRNFEKVSG